MFEKKVLKKNQPFLSVVPEILRDYPIFQNAFDWFEEISIITPNSETLFVPRICSDDAIRKFTSNLLNSSKTGVEDLDVEEIELGDFFGYDDDERRKTIEESLMEHAEKEGYSKDDFAVKSKYPIGRTFIHNGERHYASFNQEMTPVVLILSPLHIGKIKFDLEDESDGTKRLVELAPLLYELLERNTVVIVDEIERSMHPNLAKNILELFTSNSKTKSQLIFTTHESNLLDQALLRQDEIWFVEKKGDGSSELYPLSDYSERYDKDIRKGYLQGRYGAIPFMSNLTDLNWDG